ncbi:MAG: hypothetical protein AAF664_05525 [Planctomycetota bacterium]
MDEQPKPYAPPATGLRAVRRNANAWRWTRNGFLMASIPLFCLGTLGLYENYQYAANPSPEYYRCGLVMMGPYIMIFQIAPTFGFIGAAFGFVASKVCNAMNPPDVYSPDQL